jgi:serine phosphatase RsbU (regulator of sigma subunit)
MAPVTERGEVIGLLEIRVLAEPDQVALEEMSRAAHALAFAVITARRHTDLFEWGQRTTPFTLAAEIQRRLLPGSFTCEAGAFTLSAWLEPAASVGGDTFDYSVARDLLHLSMTDAMGHDVASALTATLCVGSLRNTRRQGVSLLEQADAVNRALAEHGTERFGFASGLLGRLDLQTGVLTLVNAGHIPPLLVRDGTVLEVTLPIDRPFGLIRGEVYRATEVPLQRGDRLVLVTDGMVERRAAALNLTARLAELAALHPREVVRSLADAVLEVAGPALSDDATLLVLDWYGDHGSNRSTTGGADPDRASTPHPT